MTSLLTSLLSVSNLGWGELDNRPEWQKIWDETNKILHIVFSIIGTQTDQGYCESVALIIVLGPRILGH